MREGITYIAQQLNTELTKEREVFHRVRSCMVMSSRRETADHIRNTMMDMADRIRESDRDSSEMLDKRLKETAELQDKRMKENNENVDARLFDMYEIIQKKRDGGRLSAGEIDYFISGIVAGSIPDYQASALLMAIYFQKMDYEETLQLTKAMRDSGDIADLSEIPGIKVDKHSTGGVGDKTTMIIAPMAAAAGIPVAKMSGRALGFTGGTIDKLEAIPGFRTKLAMIWRILWEF